MKQYRFTLLANHYSGPGIEVDKPFFVILGEDSPRIEKFRNPSFKEQSVDGTGAIVPYNRPVEKIGPPPKSTGPAGTDEGPPIEVILGNINTQIADEDKRATADRALIAKLKEHNYDFVGDVLDEEKPVEALCTIDKIGDATAEKILTACEQAVRSKE